MTQTCVCSLELSLLSLPLLSLLSLLSLPLLSLPLLSLSPLYLLSLSLSLSPSVFFSLSLFLSLFSHSLPHPSLFLFHLLFLFPFLSICLPPPLFQLGVLRRASERACAFVTFSLFPTRRHTITLAIIVYSCMHVFM